MKKNISRILALLLAVMMVLSAFTACGEKKNNENENDKPPVDDPKGGDTDEEEETDEYAGKVVITDTFYPQYASFSEYKEMRKKIRTWFMKEIESGDIFSASIGSTEFDTIKARMKKDVKTDKDAKGNETVVATYLDEATHIEFKLTGTIYKDYPTVDYVINVTNTSDTEKTEIIKNLNAIDSEFDIVSSKNYTVHTNRGSAEKPNDFEPIVDELKRSSKPSKYYAPTGGSSSNDVAFPFFDVIGNNEGLIMAIGWSGTWEAGFTNPTKDVVGLIARQKTFASVLLPKESIRTPSIVLTYFAGDYDYGHNVWRRCVIEHYTPDYGTEERFVAPFSLNTWGGRTAKSMIKCFEAYKNFPADIWWIDAGWYTQIAAPAGDETIMSKNDEHVWHYWLGCWSENKNLFPNGIKEVAGYVHKNSDLKFMLWWMIEDGRLNKGKDILFGIDKYYDARDKEGNLTASALRLDDDAVTDFLIDYFKDYIDNRGLDCVRLDKSTSLDWLWSNNDNVRSEAETGMENARAGITEAKYIANFYRVWDTLYEYHKDFMLDNCSSGGRRIDIELTKRSIPLWRTDYSSFDENTQAMTQFLSAWLPLSASGTFNGDQYQYRSHYSAAFTTGVSDFNEKNIAAKLAAANELVDLRPYWYGDYYQLMDPTILDTDWQAYEVYRADWQKGFVAVIRRPGSPLSAQKIKFKGLMADREYILHDIDAKDNSADIKKTGKELMDKGISLSVPARTVKCYKIELVRNDTDIVK